MIAARALKALKTLKFFTLEKKIEQEQEIKNKIGVEILNTLSVFNAVATVMIFWGFMAAMWTYGVNENKITC